MNEEWVFGISLLADVASVVGDEGHAAALYELLLPYAALNAEVYLANTTAEIARGEFKAPDKVSFAEAAETWFRHGVHVGGDRGPWKPSTTRDYRSALDRWLVPEFGGRPLHEVTSKAIGQWRRFEMAEGRLPRRTAVKLTAILHGIFERARRGTTSRATRSTSSSGSGCSTTPTRTTSTSRRRRGRSSL